MVPFLARCIVVLTAFFLVSPSVASDAIVESARKIPVEYDVDVVVVGGSTGAVAAAVAAAEGGCSVFLAAPYPYLGEDVTATLQLWPERDLESTPPLAAKLFNDPDAARYSENQKLLRPMHIKRTLDQALLDAGVSFLYSCIVTEVLHDANGQPCGLVMANRAGRQAVLAKTIIDATDNAWVARMAGAKFVPVPVEASGEKTYQVRRVVIGGEPVESPELSAQTIEPGFKADTAHQAGKSEKSYKVIEYTVDVPVEKTGSYFERAKLDFALRAKTYDSHQQFTSDALRWTPTERLVTGENPYTPAEISYLYVLDDAAEPAVLIRSGDQVGRDAAKAAKQRGPIQTPSVAVHADATPKESAKPLGDVGEILQGIRPHATKLVEVPQSERSLPVLDRYDVVVIGGGTSGAPAGIAAGRRGAKTLVVEYLHDLGGVGTAGAIARYWYGNRVGFTATIPGKVGWSPEVKSQWYRDELAKANVDVLTGAIGCGAIVERGRVVGAVVATPEGRFAVPAEVVIDATGNADLAAAAGLPCLYTDGKVLAMQGTGLPYRSFDEGYINTDWSISDETDMLDVWRMFVHGKDKYPSAFDFGKMIDTRERRRIVSEFFMTALDQILDRTYPDTICRATSDYDTHGYTVDHYFLIETPKSGLQHFCYLPYRCLLPKGIDGLLVVGLAVGVHRDAIPLIRMQPDVQNTGYAAGYAAAMAAEADETPRQIDIKTLQRHLIEIGNLDEEVLSHTDSLPYSREKIEAAVQEFDGVKNGPAAAILSHWSVAQPMVQAQYEKAGGPLKVRLAVLLAFAGDPTGVETLLEEVRNARDWDAGWNYRSMGQAGAAHSHLDAVLVALSQTKDPRAVPLVIEKAKLLDAKSDFSHFRAVVEALETLGDPLAIEQLASMLQMPGMSGHAQTSIDRIRELDEGEDENSVLTRRQSIREIFLARALYRLGDKEGLGKKILTTYADDLRGHIARHARAVLEETR